MKSATDFKKYAHALERGLDKALNERDEANALLDEIEAYVAEGMTNPHEQASLEDILSKRVKL